VRFVGNPLAVVVAETRNQARDAAELVDMEYEVLAAVVDAAKAQADDAPQIHAEAPKNTIYQWSLGDKAATEDAFARAAHIVDFDLVNNRLVPNAIEPLSASRSTTARWSLPLYTTSPESSRGAARAVSLGDAPELTARGGAGWWRRLRLEIFIYPRRPCALGIAAPEYHALDGGPQASDRRVARDHVPAEMAFVPITQNRRLAR
jgi:carbon-monoxide dehydrogenase large subunit